MVTRIIYRDIGGDSLIKEYPYLFTMSPDDRVEFNDIEYSVLFCFLDISKEVMEILVD